MSDCKTKGKPMTTCCRMDRPEQAQEIGALDLRAAATEALRSGRIVEFRRDQSYGVYTGPVEILIIGDRAGIATNADAEWGDVRLCPTNDEYEEIILDESGEIWPLG